MLNRYRKMGTDVSRVKSLTLDTWTADQVTKMKSIGNLKSNALLNPDPRNRFLDVGADESERNSSLEKFIRAKYERQIWRVEVDELGEGERQRGEERGNVEVRSISSTGSSPKSDQQAKPPIPTRANSLPVSYLPSITAPSISTPSRIDSPSLPPPRLHPVTESTQNLAAPMIRPRAATTVEQYSVPPQHQEKRFNASIWHDMGSLSLEPNPQSAPQQFAPSCPTPPLYGQPSTLYPTPGLGVHTTNPFAASMGYASNPYYANGNVQYAAGGVSNGGEGVMGYNGYQQQQPYQHQFVPPQHVPARPNSTNPFYPTPSMPSTMMGQGQQAQSSFVGYNSTTQQSTTNPFGPNYQSHRY